MEQRGEDVTITVAGISSSGKSHLTFLLKKFLREQGLDVKHELNSDFQYESEFDMEMDKTLTEFIHNFKGSKKITIKEVQLAKPRLKL